MSLERQCTEPCESCRRLQEGNEDERLLVFEGRHWRVLHAYPVRLFGWLVVVLKRHVEAMHELTYGEYRELLNLLPVLAGRLQRLTGCQKEYVGCFGEAHGYHHLHWHVIAKPAALSAEFSGSLVFGLIKGVSAEDSVPLEAIGALVEKLARDVADYGGYYVARQREE